MGRGMELAKNRKVVTNWECQGAKRGTKKGRAAGGIITEDEIGD
jgi:hypothetical protein